MTTALSTTYTALKASINLIVELINNNFRAILDLFIDESTWVYSFV